MIGIEHATARQKRSLRNCRSVEQNLKTQSNGKQKLCEDDEQINHF